MNTKLLTIFTGIFLTLCFQVNASECSAEIADSNSFPLKNNTCIIFGGAAVIDDAEHPQAPALMLRRFSPAVIAANRALAWSDRGFQTELARKTQSTTGVTMRFKTSSPSVTLQFVKDVSFVADPDNITQEEIDGKKIDTSFGQFSLTVDGVRVNSAIAPNNQTGKLILNSTGSGAQQYRLIFPIWQNPILSSLQLEQGYVLEPFEPINKPIYVAIGDSISHGQKQTVSVETWPWLVAEALNYELYNLAVGGSKTNVVQASMVAEIAEIELVTILWGYNDVHSKQKSAADYKANMLAVYNEIRSHHLNTQIVFMPILTAAAEGSHDNATPELVALENEYRVVIRDLFWELSATDDYLSLIASDTFTGVTDLASNDPVHLSIAGAAKLATAVAEEIKNMEQPNPVAYQVLEPVIDSVAPYLVNEPIVFYTQATADEELIADFSSFSQVQFLFRTVINGEPSVNEINKSVIISDGSFAYNFSDFNAGDSIQVRSAITVDDVNGFVYGPWLDLGILTEPVVVPAPQPTPEPIEEPSSGGATMYLTLLLLMLLLGSKLSTKA